MLLLWAKGAMLGTDMTRRQADFTAHRAPYEGENQAGYYASNVGKIE